MTSLLRYWKIALALLVVQTILSSVYINAQNTDAFVSIIYELPSGDLCESGCQTVFGQTESAHISSGTAGEYIVEYKRRECLQPDGYYYDIYIERIVALGSNGTDPFEESSFACVFEMICYNLLLLNPFSAVGNDIVCQRATFRMFRVACWERLNIGNSECPVLYEPCAGETNCAVDLYCIDVDGSQTVSDAHLLASYHGGTCETPPGETDPQNYEGTCEAAYGGCAVGGQ